MSKFKKMKINQGAYFSLCIEFYIRSNYCY